MNKKWKLIIGLVVLTAFLVAQQPVLVKTAGTAGSPDAQVVSIQGITSMTPVKVDPSGFTSPVSGTVTANQGGAWSVGQTGSPWGVIGVPATSSVNALTRYHASSAAAANVKASAGNLYGLILGNSGTVDCWLQFMNTAGTPTAGTSVVDSFMVQAGVTVVMMPGILALENFATGIGAVGATTDSGATTTGCTTTFSVSAYYQ